MTQYLIQVPESLDRESVVGLSQQLDSASKAGAFAPILVLKGSSELFCQGINLEYHCNVNNRIIETTAFEYAQWLERLASWPAPTIACVRGKVIGGGIGIVAACDLVISSDDAEFSLPEVLYGYIPGIILPFLLERLGKKIITRLAITGLAISANEAVSIGLVDEIHRHDLDKVATRICRNLARADPEAVGILKSLLMSDNKCCQQTNAWKQLCVEKSIALQTNSDKQAAMARFLSEGVPPWESRL